MIKGPRCENCGAERSLTKEHVIPKWLLGRVILFGVKLTPAEVHGNKRTLCANCNMEKGGMIDYTDKTVRGLMRRIAVKIIEDLKTNKPR